MFGDWHAKTHLDFLIKLLKRVIRIIAGVHPRTYTEPLFQKLNLLKCEDINKYLIGRLMFRIHNNEMPILSIFLQGTGMYILMILVKRIISISHHLKPNWEKQVSDIMELQYGIWFSELESILNLVDSSSQKVLKARYCLEIYKEYLIIFDFLITCCHVIRADSGFVPGQWGTALLCNAIPNWLGAGLELAVCNALLIWPQGDAAVILN